MLIAEVFATIISKPEFSAWDRVAPAGGLVMSSRTRRYELEGALKEFLRMGRAAYVIYWSFRTPKGP
jgi:hypothetical protein